MTRRRALTLALVTALATAAHRAHANPVGEMQLQTTDAQAELRNADHTQSVRVTIWYPADPHATEQKLQIGPPGHAIFTIGSDAPGAAAAPGAQKYPLILLSHGFGGSARMMGWFGIALARAGFIVVAVDHPGNNGIDPMTIPGAILFWDRVEDLRAALAAAQHNPLIGPRIDTARIGMAGFSAGGATTLVAAGARVDLPHFRAYCAAHPNDGVCRPQQEFPVTQQQWGVALASPVLRNEAARAADDHAIPHLRAAFVMAPALIQALNPASLHQNHIPVRIILGDADQVAPPATNGLQAATAIPGAALTTLPGVGHYDFLATCTDFGRAAVPVCHTHVPQPATHQAAIDAATAFFNAKM